MAEHQAPTQNQDQEHEHVGAGRHKLELIAGARRPGFRASKYEFTNKIQSSAQAQSKVGIIRRALTQSMLEVFMNLIAILIGGIEHRVLPFQTGATSNDATSSFEFGI